MEEQTPKKQSNISSILAIVVVLAVGGYVVWSAVNSAQEASAPVDEHGHEHHDHLIDADGKGTGSLIQSAGQFGEPGAPNFWVDSQKQIAFSAPHEWEVHQNDAGSVQFIEVFDPKNVSDVMTVWLQSTQIGSEAGDLTLAQWMELSVQGLADIEVCDRRDIAGFDMACLRATNAKMTWNMYFAELNNNTLIGIFKTLEANESPDLKDVVNSIYLNPTAEDVEDAIVIP